MASAVLNSISTTRAFDLAKEKVRALNEWLHAGLPNSGIDHVDVLNPDGAHSIAVGINAPVSIDIHGHAGYYCAGMNKFADIAIHGNVGWGVAENMMSGSVRVKGFASEAAGATGHGGLLVIEGDASLRCGISMKGIDIVVGGRVGNFSAFMAQAGHFGRVRRCRRRARRFAVRSSDLRARQDQVARRGRARRANDSSGS